MEKKVMGKEEFEKRMGRAIMHIEREHYNYPAEAIANAFAFPNIITAAKIQVNYLQFLNHLFMTGVSFMDWEKQGIKISEHEKKKKLWLAHLKKFKEQCLKDEFYKELRT